MTGAKLLYMLKLYATRNYVVTAENADWNDSEHTS